MVTLPEHVSGILGVVCLAALMLGIVAVIVSLVFDLAAESRLDRSRGKQLLDADRQLDRIKQSIGCERQTPDRPVRIQQQRVAGWTTPGEAIRVGRGAEWGNPWRAGDLLPLPGCDGSIRVTATLAVDLYAAWVTERGWLDLAVEELAGYDLVCWCRIGEPCHADWLVEVVNRYGDVEEFIKPTPVDTRQSSV